MALLSPRMIIASIKHNGSLITIAAMYVDVMIITSNDLFSIPALKHLDAAFNIKDLGELSFFLDLEISYLPKGITMTQKKFTRELLSSFGITKFKPVVTPLPLNHKLYAATGDLLPGPSSYRCLVGKLNLLTNSFLFSPC